MTADSSAAHFNFWPDARHHVGLADELLSVRLGQLSRLAGTAARLWPGDPDSLVGLLSRLPELGHLECATLADDPFLHASFTGLVAALRAKDTVAAQRSLARLVPVLLVPAAAILDKPIELRVGPGGRLGLTAIGPRLRLPHDLVGQAVRFYSGDNGDLVWEIDARHHGVVVPGTPGCGSVPLLPGTRATGFDCDDERLKGMLSELGANPDSFAVETVTPAQTTPQLRQEMEACFERLGACWPEMRQEIESCVRLIVPVRSQQNSSFSNTAWQGAVFLRDDFADPLFLIERIVHESSHVRLNVVMVFEALHEHPWDDRVESPFRAGPRPVTGLVHGALVFTRAAEAVIRVSRDSPLEQLGAARAVELLQKVGNALATLRSAVRLTTTGEMLIAEIETEYKELLSQCRNASAIKSSL
jgi:HEXXH motif-containing protein